MEPPKAASTLTERLVEFDVRIPFLSPERQFEKILHWRMHPSRQPTVDIMVFSSRDIRHHSLKTTDHTRLRLQIRLSGFERLSYD